MSATYTAGRNIALKVPPHQYDATVTFYREVLKLQPLENHLPAIGFAFGSNQLWVDRMPGLSQAEVWLEILTDDVPAADAEFEAAGVTRRDEIEPLPEGHAGFWICDPSSIILHVGAATEQW